MAIADRLGLLIGIHIEPRNRFDRVLTERTLDATFVAKLPPRLIADKASDGGALSRRLAEERGIERIDALASRRSGEKKQAGRPFAALLTLVSDGGKSNSPSRGSIAGAGSRRAWTKGRRASSASFSSDTWSGYS
jgi:hypothetical protein